MMWGGGDGVWGLGMGAEEALPIVVTCKYVRVQLKLRHCYRRSTGSEINFVPQPVTSCIQFQLQICKCNKKFKNKFISEKSWRQRKEKFVFFLFADNKE